MRKTIYRCISLSFFFWIVIVYCIGILSFGGYTQKPDKHWEKEVQNSQVIVAFGFGLTKDSLGNFTAGKSNEAIFNRMVDFAGNKTIIAQEGILLALKSKNCKIANTKLKNDRFVRMHPHNNHYINTFDAARFALEKIRSCNTDKHLKICIFSHDKQLKRAASDLERIARTEEQWRNYTFVIPDIKNIPFDKNSLHFQTRYAWIYFLIEIFFSRPRDFITFFLIKWGWLTGAIGIFCILTYYLFLINYRKKHKQILPKDEDNIMSLFVLSNSGIWLTLISSIILLHWFEIIHFTFNIWIGLMLGLIIGIRILMFWNHSDMYAQKPALGEPIGKMGAGCFALCFNILFGGMLGILL